MAYRKNGHNNACYEVWANDRMQVEVVAHPSIPYEDLQTFVSALSSGHITRLRLDYSHLHYYNCASDSHPCSTCPFDELCSHYIKQPQTDRLISEVLTYFPELKV